MTDMISLDEYMHVAEADYYKPGEDSCPFEPGSDWGWFEGRVIALDWAAKARDGLAGRPTMIARARKASGAVMCGLGAVLLAARRNA